MIERIDLQTVDLQSGAAAVVTGELRKWHRLLEAPGTTVVPLSLYFLGSKVKVELGMATGRTKGDRRNREKEKEARREIRDASRKGR